MNGAVCGYCGYEPGRPIFEIEDELLERCPSCGAYQWVPEPVKVPAPAREGSHD